NHIVVLGAPGPQQGFPGMLGALAQARAEGVAQARSGGAGVRVLGDAELALAVARGAMIVPGLTSLGDIEAGGADRFWIQPEAFSAPTAAERQVASRNVLGMEGELVAGKERPKLGSITGDPWADWALTTGGSVDPEGLMLAANDRDKLLSSGKGRVLLAAL